MKWKDAKTIITSDPQVVAELTDLENQYQLERSRLLMLRSTTNKRIKIGGSSSANGRLKYKASVQLSRQAPRLRRLSPLNRRPSTTTTR